LNLFGTISYAAAAVFYLILAALLLTSWRGRSPGFRLILAAGVSAVWAAAIAWSSWSSARLTLFIYVLELLRNGAWFYVLTGLAHGLRPRWPVIGSHFLWGGLLAVAVIFGTVGLLIPGGLAMALLVLVLLEQIYRNANASGRYGFKFLAIGLGGVFAYDLFMYSQAQLMQGVSQDLWSARGWISALLVPAIAISARRSPAWSLDVFISRQAVVFSTAITAVGLYLLAMAIGGYYVRLGGGRWGAAANAIFFVGALAVLAAIIASGTVRRKLRVFVAKHFYRNKYDYRVEWLRFVQTLSSVDGADIRETGLKAMAQVFESPGAFLYMRGHSGRQFVPTASWPTSLNELPELGPIPLDHELVQLIARKQWIVDLQEYAAEPVAYQNISLPEWMKPLRTIRVIAPLLQQRELVGLVLLLAPRPPFNLTFEDRDLLKTLGRHVATIIAQHDADRRLAESRQFEAYHRLTAFMMHDLKNSVAQLQLIVSNADRHKHKPEFVEDAISTIANATQRISRLMEQLRDQDGGKTLQACNLTALILEVVSRCGDRQPVPVLVESPASTATIRADFERLANALEHVIRNAQEASSRSDQISVRWSESDGMAEIVVTDTGAGMTPEFIRTRLFKPFDSTKGSKGMGIGAYQVREYVRSLDGEVEVQSSPGSGTAFHIRLPVSIA
jgi:putative PEP-CTERM system histidine kinase